jgi:hypothetical protein
LAPSRSARPGWPLDATEVERLRQELPPPITERGSGRPTHGRWVGADGVVQPIVSGVDDWSRYGDAVFERMDVGPYQITSHTEMKVAAKLRAEFERVGQPQHAAVVLNNVPCRRPAGCGNLLPVMLPDGCSLTVHAPDYRRRFTGGMAL